MCKCEQECKLEYVLKLYHLILFLKFNVFVMLSCTPSPPFCCCCCCCCCHRSLNCHWQAYKVSLYAVSCITFYCTFLSVRGILLLHRSTVYLTFSFMFIASALFIQVQHLKSKCDLFVCWLPSQPHASVSQGRICSDSCMCCHTEIEVADQTFHLTQSQYTDTGLTSPSADPIMPGAWQGSHLSANF